MTTPKPKPTIDSVAGAETARRRLAELDTAPVPHAAERDELRTAIAAWETSEQERKREALLARAADLAARIDKKHRERAANFVVVRRNDGELLALAQEAAQVQRDAAELREEVDLPAIVVDDPASAREPEKAGEFYLFKCGLGPPPATYQPDPITAGRRAASETISRIRAADRQAGIPVSGRSAAPAGLGSPS